MDKINAAGHLFTDELMIMVGIVSMKNGLELVVTGVFTLPEGVGIGGIALGLGEFSFGAVHFFEGVSRITEDYEKFNDEELIVS